MARTAAPSVIEGIESLYTGGSIAGLTDQDLIERFTRDRDSVAETAFAALVARHGPMVLGVCRQFLGDPHHAEDAFQAVFLVLARRAKSIRNPALLSNWLYGVALRTARKARARLTKARQREQEDAAQHPEIAAGLPPLEPIVAREEAEALHQEIGRLPAAFRLPVVLCYFEGLSIEDAANRLRWPHGTVRSRLARARDRLRRGLTRRGVVLPTAALAAVLEATGAKASIASPLCDSTTRAAIQFVAGHTAAKELSTMAAPLAQEVLKSIFVRKLRLTALFFLFVAAGTTGLGYLSHSMTVKGERENARAGSPPQIASKQDERAVRAAPGRMFVVGRVVDPQGNPVQNATTMVSASMRFPGSDETGEPRVIGQATSDGSGRFRLDSVRTSSSIHYEVRAIASAPGHGAGWVELDLDADQPAAEITLRPEQVIEGRMFDVQGGAVAGVRVSVEAMGHTRPDPEGDDPDETFEGPYFGDGKGANLPPAWPRPATTDAQGRFTLTGVGRGLRVFLMADAPRFARQRIKFNTDNTSGRKPVTMALEPARIIKGRVTYADTGKPVPHAEVGISPTASQTVTDAEGWFRANTQPEDRYVVMVNAPRGQPYLDVRTQEFQWPKGAVEHRVDVTLPRGTMVRGKVTEAGTGKPVAGAILGYSAHSTEAPRSVQRATFGRARPDGSFEFAVLPRSGYLIVAGPTEDYVLEEIGNRTLDQNKPGGTRMYAHAFIDCNPKSEFDFRDVRVALTRGMTVKGRIIGPDGQPVDDAQIASRIILMPGITPWGRSWMGNWHASARAGRFELHGLALGAPVPVFFLDPNRRLGATVNFSGQSSSGGPVTVRLDPCGSAKARLVTPGGTPVAEHRDPNLLVMVVTAGPARFSRDAADEGRLAADQDYVCRIDSINYALGSVSDAEGRVVFPALIPGATYRIYDTSDDGERLRQEFTVKSGETLDLGDLVIEKPEK